MSGVYWCCCTAGVPPNPCPCQCVCDYAWQFWPEGHSMSTNYRKQYGYLAYDAPLIDGDGPWAMVVWPWHCAEGASGTIVSIYEERNPNNTPIYNRIYDRFHWHAVPNLNDWIELKFRIEGTNGDKETHQAELDLDQSTLPGNCPMLVAQYQQVTHSSGNKQVQIQLVMRYNAGDDEGGPVDIQEKIETITRPENPVQDWKLNIENDWKTTVGDHVGRCSEYYPGDQLNPNAWQGCLSNFTIYGHWLDATELDRIWNDWEGLIDVENADEQWCSPYRFCESDQVGAVNNTTLTPYCYIHDHNGEAIETDEDGHWLCTVP